MSAADVDKERRAWARLVRATDAAATEIRTAEQALRDLGVDVDTLLKETGK